MHGSNGGPLEQRADGEWVLAPPLPLYRRSWWWPRRWQYVCECGKPFRDEAAYRLHWRVAALANDREEA